MFCETVKVIKFRGTVRLREETIKKWVEEDSMLLRTPDGGNVWRHGV